MPDDNAAAFGRSRQTEAAPLRAERRVKRPAEPRGRAYVLPCSSTFRNKVMALAAQRGVSAGDLARAVLLLIPKGVLAQAVEPSEPTPEDREIVKLQSGPTKGRTLKRKPRLQLRLPAGHDMAELRRALSLALDLAAGEQEIAVENDADRQTKAESDRARDRQSDEINSLRRIIDTIALRPLENGVTLRGEALHVLGFSPFAMPDRASIRSRFRQLARVYHPDAPLGDHVLMSQLNEALERLSPS
jgi:hypothetical protein